MDIYFHWSDLEKIIDNSLNYINKKGILIKQNPKYINGKYINEGCVDYIGYLNNVIFCIEAKKTKNIKYFYISKIRKNQFIWLNKFALVGIAYLCFYFEYYEKYVLIDYKVFLQLINNTSVSIKKIIDNGKEISLKNNKTLYLYETLLQSINFFNNF